MGEEEEEHCTFLLMWDLKTFLIKMDPLKYLSVLPLLIIVLWVLLQTTTSPSKMTSLTSGRNCLCRSGVSNPEYGSLPKLLVKSKPFLKMKGTDLNSSYY